MVGNIEGWMDLSLIEWMEGFVLWTGGSLVKRMGVCFDGRMDVCLVLMMIEWIDGYMFRWLDRMDERTN